MQPAQAIHILEMLMDGVNPVTGEVLSEEQQREIDEIKQRAKEKGVYLWQVAERLGLNDGNFSRKLRKELSQEEKEKILSIINEIAKEKTAV